jgi:hypothetical protein
MLVVFVCTFYRAVLRLVEERRNPEIAFLVATSVYFMSESTLVRIENPFTIFFWYLIIRWATDPSQVGIVSRKRLAAERTALALR